MAESASFYPPEETAIVAEPSPAPSGEPLAYTGSVARAQSRLITHYRTPRNLAILAGFVREVQAAEDAAAGLYVSMRLPNAAGEALDFLGRIVGEKRLARGDDDYRQAIATRILVSRSKGRVEDLIAVARSLVPTATIQVAEYWPPALSFSFSTLGSVTFDTAFRMLRQAKAAGVRLEMTYGPGTLGSEDDTYLGGTMGSEDDTTLGFTMASTA